MYWIGWLWHGDAWHPQPSTRSTCLGTCSARLGVLGRYAGVPCTHQVMTGGAVPQFIPAERPAMPEETRLDVEEENP